MRRLALAVLTSLVVLLLAGCGQVNAELGTVTTTVKTPRGPVLCAVYAGSNAGGLDCDWDHPLPASTEGATP